MLAQGGLGLPNLAAISAAGPVSLALFVNHSVVYAPIMLRHSALSLVVNQSVFYPPRLEADAFNYTYPIGRYPDSDYGIRSSMTFYKRRLIIGRR